MAPSPDARTFFKTEGGRGQPGPGDLRELVDKADKSEKERTGVNGILLGPPGAENGMQVCKLCL